MSSSRKFLSLFFAWTIVSMAKPISVSYDDVNFNFKSFTDTSSGTVIYNTEIRFYDQDSNTTASFSAHFFFSVQDVNQDSSGDGISLFLSHDDDTLGSSGGYLDRVNSSQSVKNRFVAIEVITKTDHHFNDPSGNHITLDVDSLSSITASDLLFSLKNDLKSGKSITVWVDYKNHLHLLNMLLSHSDAILTNTSIKKPEKPLLSVNVDLSSFLKDEMSVGFSVSTEGSTEIPLIKNWSFKSFGFLPVRPKIIKIILHFSVPTVEKYQKLEKLVEHVTKKISFSDTEPDSHSSKSSFHLVFEYLDADLSKFIASYRMGTNHRPLEPILVQRFMLQLCRGVSHCHSHDVLHRDLKPQNVPLDEHKYVLKTADFWSVAVDMWSVGCIFFCLALFVFGFLTLTAEKGLKTANIPPTLSSVVAANSLSENSSFYLLLGGLHPQSSYQISRSDPMVNQQQQFVIQNRPFVMQQPPPTMMLTTQPRPFVVDHNYEAGFGPMSAPLTEELAIPLLLCAGFRTSSTIFLSPILFSLAHLNHFRELYVKHNRSYLDASLIVGFQLVYTAVFGSKMLFETLFGSLANKEGGITMSLLFSTYRSCLVVEKPAQKNRLRSVCIGSTLRAIVIGTISALTAGTWAYLIHKEYFFQLTLYASIIGYFVVRVAYAENPQSDRFGFVAQYVLKPLLGVLVANVFGMPRIFYAGFVLTCYVAGAQLSSYANSLSKADVAMSILLTSCTTIASVLFTPLLSSLLIGSVVPVDAVAMSKFILEDIDSCLMSCSHMCGGCCSNLPLMSDLCPMPFKLLPKLGVVTPLPSNLKGGDDLHRINGAVS